MKKISIILSLLFVSFAATAQTEPHEFSVHVNGGLSSLQYSPAIGSQSSKFAPGFGLGYTYNLSPTLALKTGLDFAFYNSSFEANSINEMYTIPHPTIDPAPAPGANTTFYFYGDYTNYEESQSALYLNIPIMAQYSLPIVKNIFYGAAGVKIGFPLSGTYESTANQLKNWGESLYTNEQYHSEHGFGVVNNPSYNGDLNLNISFMLALEAGMKWEILEHWTLYTGIYFDYGLTNLQKDSNKAMLEYKESGLYSYRSTLQSATNGINVDKINNMAVGIKVAIAFR